MRKKPTITDVLAIFLGWIILFVVCLTCYSIVIYGLKFISPGVVWSAELSGEEETTIDESYKVAQMYYETLGDYEEETERAHKEVGIDTTEFANLSCWMHLIINVLCDGLADFKLCPSITKAKCIIISIDNITTCGMSLDLYMVHFRKKVDYLRKKRET